MIFCILFVSFYFARSLNAIVTAPVRIRITPVMRLSVFALALFAILAAICAQMKVKTTQKTSVKMSLTPLSMAKWLTEPVRAVNVIMNTLVPTAVFSS